MLVILKKENMTMTKTEIKKALETFPEAWKDLLKEEIEKPYYQNLIDAVAASYENEKVYDLCIEQIITFCKFNEIKYIRN